MRQTAAIFLDAYRELNSRKLFWISLSISLAVVLALALPTQTDKGLSVFGAKLETGHFQIFGSKAVSGGGFYKFIFSFVGINLWLGWGATILALVSTASMVPEMISSGSIELSLSKPVTRLRLFLTKYAAGLTFVALQAGVFALGAVLVIGVRGGSWDARPLLVVPIMVAFFSFLYCVAVLVGMLTRSTLMSLIAVILVWLFVWALGSVEGVFLTQRREADRAVAKIEAQIKGFDEAIALVDAQLARLPNEPEASAPSRSPSDPPSTPDAPPAPDAAAAGAPPTPPDAPRPRPGGRRDRWTFNKMLQAGDRMLRAATDQDPASLRARREGLVAQRNRLEADLPLRREEAESMTRWHRRLYAAFFVLPKTGETKDLFKRYVIDKKDMDGFLRTISDLSDGDANPQDAQLDRPLWWVLGTSFAFEAVVLGLATWIFCRRDF
jgi:ABC-type transport system involved in multi-copper enzyme maturation permease subunit